MICAMMVAGVWDIAWESPSLVWCWMLDRTGLQRAKLGV